MKIIIIKKIKYCNDLRSSPSRDLICKGLPTIAHSILDRIPGFVFDVGRNEIDGVLSLL
jgi:hypothetical protein